MNQPFVSIIVPVFNRATIISTCLKSLSDQLFSNWEAIVVDDRSSDGTARVVKEMGLKDARIKYHLNTGNKGACASRNYGVQKAVGEFIIFLDSDDSLLPFALQQRIKLAEAHTALDFIISPGLVTHKETDKSYYWNIKTTIPDVERFLAMDSPWQTTGPLWKKQFLIDNNLYWDEKLAMWQDVDFHLRVLLQPSAYRIFWEAPYDYIVNAASADSLSRTSYYDENKLQARFYFWEKYVAQTGGSIAAEWLKPLLLLVSSQAVAKRMWKKAAGIIETAIQYKVISSFEGNRLKKNMTLSRLSFNRVSFPSARLKKILEGPSSFLQTVAVNK